jgi:hypothetical protein
MLWQRALMLLSDAAEPWELGCHIVDICIRRIL